MVATTFPASSGPQWMPWRRFRRWWRRGGTASSCGRPTRGCTAPDTCSATSRPAADPPCRACSSLQKMRRLLMESVLTFQEPEGREGIKGRLDEMHVGRAWWFDTRFCWLWSSVCPILFGQEQIGQSRHGKWGNWRNSRIKSIKSSVKPPWSLCTG